MVILYQLGLVLAYVITIEIQAGRLIFPTSDVGFQTSLLSSLRGGGLSASWGQPGEAEAPVSQTEPAMLAERPEAAPELMERLPKP